MSSTPGLIVGGSGTQSMINNPNNNPNMNQSSQQYPSYQQQQQQQRYINPNSVQQQQQQQPPLSVQSSASIQSPSPLSSSMMINSPLMHQTATTTTNYSTNLNHSINSPIMPPGSVSSQQLPSAHHSPMPQSQYNIYSPMQQPTQAHNSYYQSVNSPMTANTNTVSSNPASLAQSPSFNPQQQQHHHSHHNNNSSMQHQTSLSINSPLLPPPTPPQSNSSYHHHQQQQQHQQLPLTPNQQSNSLNMHVNSPYSSMNNQNSVPMPHTPIYSQQQQLQYQQPGTPGSTTPVGVVSSMNMNSSSTSSLQQHLQLHQHMSQPNSYDPSVDPSTTGHFVNQMDTTNVYSPNS